MTMNDGVHYVTAESFASLQAEYEKLKNKTIPDIARRIDDAKQQGDLSENAEYHQAREDMSWAQGRVLELDQIIQNAQLVAKVGDAKTVSFASTVTVRVNGKEKDYTIVGAQEVDVTKGYISNESPIGSALLGHKIKDKVEIVSPAGKQVYEIIKIK